MPRQYNENVAEKNNQKLTIKDLAESIKKGVQDVFTSDKYKEWLTVSSKFHNYSWRNTILIQLQCPDATLVKGYSSWKKDFERQVNTGEKAIKIIAPMVFKKDVERKNVKTGEVKKENETFLRYKAVSVFDVSQTSGRDLPTLTTELTGSITDYSKILTVLDKVSQVPITYEDLSYEKNLSGYFKYSKDNTDNPIIVISKNLSEIATVKTIIHEISHSELHDPNKTDIDKNLTGNEREVQAESIAYIVCCNLGLDTSEYSFPYIASWSQGKEVSHLEKHLETIQKTSSLIIEKIQENIKELSKTLDERLNGIEPKKIVDLNNNDIDDRAEKENYTISNDPANSDKKINIDFER